MFCPDCRAPLDIPDTGDIAEGGKCVKCDQEFKITRIERKRPRKQFILDVTSTPAEGFTIEDDLRTALGQSRPGHGEDMEPLHNILIREIKKKLGHGGFWCAITETGYARFTCSVPKRFTVRLHTWKGNLHARMEIDTWRRADGLTGLIWTRRVMPLHDPNVDPDKIVDDIVEIIKIVKLGFTNMKKLGLTKFPKRLQKKADVIWSQLGRQGQNVGCKEDAETGSQRDQTQRRSDLHGQKTQ